MIAITTILGDYNRMKSILRGFLLAGVLVVSSPRWGSAQEEYFRELGSARETSQVMPLQPEEEQKYNLMLGPIRFSAAAGVGLEWNDNIALSEHNRESDFIFRPSATLDAAWRISELNTLRFSIGLSYAKYFSHHEFDSRGLLLSPNSELAFSVHVGQVTFTIRDQFSYQEDPFDLPVLSGVANYRRYQNLANIQADWQPNEAVKISVGYNHYNLWATQPEFSSLTQTVDTVYARPSIQITPPITLKRIKSPNQRIPKANAYSLPI